MTSSVTCQKVTSLLSMYIDNKLDYDLHEFVRRHLEICPECHKKYVMLKQLLAELRNAYKDLIQDTEAHEKKQIFNIKEYEKFHDNLSAYFDNELPLNESVNIKKYMIKFPNARKDLEEMYNLHKIISNSVVCVKKNFNKDYSKTICYELQGIDPSNKKAAYIKIASFAGIIIILAALFLTTLPVGKTVIDKGVNFLKHTIYVQKTVNQELALDLIN